MVSPGNQKRVQLALFVLVYAHFVYIFNQIRQTVGNLRINPFGMTVLSPTWK